MGITENLLAFRQPGYLIEHSTSVHCRAWIGKNFSLDEQINR